MPRALVAQLDRASDFDSEGREFESLRARHFPPGCSRVTASRLPTKSPAATTTIGMFAVALVCGECRWDTRGDHDGNVGFDQLVQQPWQSLWKAIGIFLLDFEILVARIAQSVSERMVSLDRLT